jgi:integrase
MAWSQSLWPEPHGTVGHRQVAPRLYRRGNQWWADLRLHDGTRRRVATGETDEAAARRRAEQLAIELGAPAASKFLTLALALEDTYCNHWHGTRSAIIVRRVVDVIQREMGHLSIADVNYQRLDAYARALLRDGLAPATVNRRMSAISTSLNECVKRGELMQRPQMPHFRENNVKDRYMSTAEEAAILEQLDKKVRLDAILDRNVWEYIGHLYVFLLDTGFRFSEAFAFRLDGDHADLRNGTTKNNQGRRVPLTKRAKAAAIYMQTCDRHRELKALPGKAPWDWVSHRWRLLVRDAGCPDVTLHILRHTCASRLVQRGIPIYVVSKWLGHSSVKITERYAKLAPDSLSKALAALEESSDDATTS